MTAAFFSQALGLAAAAIGVHAICADAIDHAAAAFCPEHQFMPFGSRPHSLYLPMKTVLVVVVAKAGTALTRKVR